MAFGYNFVTSEEMDARKLVEGICIMVAHHSKMYPHYHPSERGNDIPYIKKYPISELIPELEDKSVHSFYDPVRCLKFINCVV